MKKLLTPIFATMLCAAVFLPSMVRAQELVASVTARTATQTDFARQVMISPHESLELTPETALTNFPVLVRLSESISGFSYADFKAENHADMMFVDDRGNVMPYEVQTWEPDGTSLVWVRVPELKTDTTFHLYYSSEAVSAGTLAVPENNPRETWSEYIGVWHLDELGGGGRVSESGPLDMNGYAANTATGIVAGVIGPCREIRHPDGTAEGGIIAENNYGKIPETSRFTVSCWARLNAKSTGWDHLIYKKNASGDWNGWGLELYSQNGTYGQMSIIPRADNNNAVRLNHGIAETGTWYHLGYIYDGNRAESYNNGVRLSSGNFGGGNFATMNNTNIRPISIGCSAKGDGTWNGAIDEVRVLNGAASAAWMKAEYIQMVSATAFAYAATETDAALPVFDAVPSITRNADGSFTVSATLSAGIAEIYALADDGVSVKMTEGIVSAPWSGSVVLSGLAPDTAYSFAVKAVSASGTIVYKDGAETFYSGSVTAEKISDAHELTREPGVIRFSRSSDAAAACRYPVTIGYSVGGTAEADSAYEPISGSVTIPAGASTVDVSVVPILNYFVDSDVTVTVTPDDGLISTFGDDATLTILNYRHPQIGSRTKCRAITVSGYTAESYQETLTDFRLLVRLDADTFSYPESPDGANLLFVSGDGQVLAHEIDTWNVGGESLVWVKMNRLVPGENKLWMYYGGNVSGDVDPTDVWDGYVGVWHMNETGDGAVTIADATANGLEGTTSDYSGTAAGVLGNARTTLNSERHPEATGYSRDSHILVPDRNDKLNSFREYWTVSLWMRLSGEENWGYLVCRKDTDNDGPWGLQFAGATTGNGEPQKMRLWHENHESFPIDMGRRLNDKAWHKVTAVYNGSLRSFYVDGVQIANDWNAGHWSGNTSQTPLSIGGLASTGEQWGAFIGDVDEVRLIGTVCSDDRIRAMYQQDVNPGFSSVSTEEISLGVKTTIGAVKVDDAAGTPRLSVALTSGSGEVFVTYTASDGSEYVVSLGEVMAGEPVYHELQNADTLPKNTYFTYSLKVVDSENGEVITLDSDDTLIYNGMLTLRTRRDAALQNLSPGAFYLERPTNDATLAREMTVSYTLGGTAVAGEDYKVMSGTATFAVGQSCIELPIELLETATAGRTVSVTLDGHGVCINPQSAELTIRDGTIRPNRKIAFRATGYTGAALDGDSAFPALVRLREGLCGFSYADCWFDDGSDIRFTDTNGTVLEHDIDTWDITGESTVWVKIPGFSSQSQVVMAYGSPRTDASDTDAVVRRKSVWDGQSIVLHLNEGKNDNNELIFSNSAQDKIMDAWHRNTTFVSDGVVGVARRISDKGKGAGGNDDKGTGIFVSNQDGLDVGATFVISGWLKYKQGQQVGNDRIFVRKKDWNSGDGWMVTLAQNSPTYLDIRGATQDVCQKSLLPDGWNTRDEWMHVACVYEETKVSVYVNGTAVLTDGVIQAAIDNNEKFCIGNESSEDDHTFKGAVDEVRFAKGAPSADRIKADYETVAKPDFWDAWIYNPGSVIVIR